MLHLVSEPANGNTIGICLGKINVLMVQQNFKSSVLVRLQTVVESVLARQLVDLIWIEAVFEQLAHRAFE